MTHDAFSDLVLAITCLCIAVWHLLAPRGGAGIGVACSVIGVAAMLGVVRFSNWSPINERMLGPHQFASTLAAVGAFPVLAYSIACPASPLVRRVSGACGLMSVIGGLGWGVTWLGCKPWAQMAPAISALGIAAGLALWYRGRKLLLGSLGLLFLLGAFLVTLAIPTSDRVLGMFSSTQLFHYILSVGLSLIATTSRDATAE